MFDKTLEGNPHPLSTRESLREGSGCKSVQAPRSKHQPQSGPHGPSTAQRPSSERRRSTPMFMGAARLAGSQRGLSMCECTHFNLIHTFTLSRQCISRHKETADLKSCPPWEQHVEQKGPPLLILTARPSYCQVQWRREGDRKSANSEDQVSRVGGYYEQGKQERRARQVD